MVSYKLRMNKRSSNKKWVLTPILAFLVLLLLTTQAQAAITHYINFQGKLTDADDNPLAGTYSVTFRFYSASTGGSALWTETQSVTVTNGIFNAILGSTTAFSSTIDFNSDLWLSIQVGSDSEMTPRQRICAVGYGINADTVDALDSSQFIRSDADDTTTGSLTFSGVTTDITTGTNEDFTINPNGTGSVIVNIDAASTGFQITDGTTNWFTVDDAGNITTVSDGSTDLFNITVGNLKVGNGTPTKTQDGEDAYIEGMLELDGYAYFDSDVTVSGSLYATGTGSAGGWTDDGTVVRLTTSTDNVGIGTTTPTQALDVVGSVAISQNITLSGAEIWFGSDTNLFRYGANTLKTDDSLIVGGTLTTQGSTTINGDQTITGDLTVQGGDITGAGSTALDLGEATSGQVQLTGTGGLKLISTGADLTFDNNGVIDNDSSGTIGFNTDLSISGGDITGANSQYIDIGEENTTGVTTSGDLFVKDGDITGKNSEKLSLGDTDNVITFTSNAQEIMRIHSNDNVGIGTTTPTAKLHVWGDTKINQDLTVSGSTWLGDASTDNLTVTGALSFSGNLDMNNNLITNIGNANTDFTSGGGLVLAGNLGIGTTSPIHKLDVYGITGDTILGVGDIPNVGNPSVYMQADATNGLGIFETRSNHPLVLGVNNVERVRINTSGNVGIGTTNPLAKLHVVGALYDAGVGEPVSNTGDKLYVAGNTGISGDLTVGGNVTYSGDLTQSGTNMLYLADGTATAPSLTFSSDMDTGLFRPAAETIAFTTAGTEDMRIASGNVGIGTTGPSAQFEIRNGNNWIKFAQDTGFGITTDSYLRIRSTMGLQSGIDMYLYDDQRIIFEAGLTAPQIGTETADANAYTLNIELPTGSSTRVPVLVIGEQNIENKDLGFFNGITQPRVGIIDLDRDTHLDVGFNADDVGMVQVVGAGTNLSLNPSGGNVGIGTTSPQQKLHVEGQCVTGDTLLPVIRRDVVAQFIGQADLSLINQATTIPIVEVKPGDYVLSFNEETAKIEPRRINGLLDMGVKPVFKLTTEDGRTIKTTGNHPYLTKEGWKKVVELQEGTEIAVAKEINGRVFVLPDGDIPSAPLLQDPQELLRQPLSFPLFFTSSYWIDNYSGENKHYTQDGNGDSPEDRKFFKEITGQSYHKDSLSQVSGSFGNKLYLILMHNLHLVKLYHTLEELSRFIFGDFAYAQMVIRQSDISWDKIISIEYLGYEQVYDIEVEGTHNFVAGHWIESKAGKLESWKAGNPALQPSSHIQPSSSLAIQPQYFFGGIIAHNTYISTAAGIVNSPPSGDQLYVAGNAGISGDLTIGGNVTYSGDLTQSGTNMLYLADGTATAPSLTFSSDMDTGMFRPAAESIAFTTAGTEDMRIASGNVGIGTTSPTGALDVIGTSKFDAVTFSTSIITEAPGDFIRASNNAYISWGNSDYVKMEWDSTQETNDGFRIGIGVGSADTAGNIIISDVNDLATTWGHAVSSDPTIYLQSADATSTSDYLKFWHNQTDGNIDVGAGKLHLATGGTTALTIDTSQNVGIGTTSPVQKLHVSGTALATSIGATEAPPSGDLLYVAGNAGISGDLTVGGNVTYSGDLTQSGTNMLYLADGTATAPSLTFSSDMDTGMFRPAAETIAFTTAGTEDMRIANGNVGIGTTSPTSKLDVVGGAMSVASDQRVNLAGASGNTYLAFDSSGPYISFYVNGTEVARLKP